MEGDRPVSADDQRAAEDRADDVMAELHECTEGVNPYGGMAARALALIQDRDDEVDRLRAELAETRTELNRMRDVAHAEDAAKRHAMVSTDVWKMRADRYAVAGDAMADDLGADDPNAAEWRSVRGDAPTEPLHEWRCPGCGTTTRARMADAPAEPPAVERSEFYECRCGHQWQNHIGLYDTRCNAGEPCSCSAFEAARGGSR